MLQEAVSLSCSFWIFSLQNVSPPRKLATDRAVFFHDSYDDIRSIFGMHLDWILFIILLGTICWGYIKYIRPQLHQNDEVRIRCAVIHLVKSVISITLIDLAESTTARARSRCVRSVMPFCAVILSSSRWTKTT